MNNTTKDRKNIFYTAMLIMTLLITIIGVVYAFTLLMDSQEEGSTSIYTGTLTINYITGRKIECKLMPIYTPIDKNDPDAYINNFSIKNSGTLNAVMTIYLKINENEFADDSIKYNLYNSNDEVISTGRIVGTGDIVLANNILLNVDEVADYTLQIWLEENNENQNEEMRKTLLGTIEVDSIQEKE